jgi:CO/xanthine dehydrogenase FAD-binding subunit
MVKFEYHEPRTVAQAVSLLAQYGDDGAPLAGGTALLIDMRHGERRIGHLISLWGIDELRRIMANGSVHIGALTTITELAEYGAELPALCGLVEAARLLGPRQVQNVATVGGNICKASPGADMVPPLLCLDAQLRLAGQDGERTIPLDGFLTGPDRTAIRPAEILIGIKVPPPEAHSGSAFLKVMRRQAVDCSIVAVAAQVWLAEDGQRCAGARVAIGAAAPFPFRAKRAEETLVGAEIEAEVAHEAARLARDESRPISDVRASADYRLVLVETLVERAILQAAERAAQRGERQ